VSSRWLLLAALTGCSAPAEPTTAPPRPARAGAPAATAERATAAPLGALEDPTYALAPFYRSLAAGGRTLIAQFGDSHTAGDGFTGRLRAVLQAQHGDAGRGFVLTGRPAIRHYELRDLRYAAQGWNADQGGKRGTEEPYGLGGVRSYASRSSAEAWIETCGDCPTGTAVDRFEIFFWRRQDAGVLDVRVDDGAWTSIHTALAGGLDAPVPDYAAIDVPDGAHRLTLRPRVRGKAVSVFGIAMERHHPGVVVDGLGIVGLQMTHLWSWDWAVIGAQLAHRGPALVILQYGTNEVDNDDLDLALFEQRYVELIGRVRAAVPGTAVLVLGPPDRAVREHTRKECERAQKKLDRLRRKAKDPAGVPAVPEGCEWRTPQKLLDIVEAERRVARRAGVAFFDSFHALGGPDRIDAMGRLDPPLAYEDHVHLTAAGYAGWADLVLEDLMRGQAAWEKLPTSAR